MFWIEENLILSNVLIKGESNFDDKYVEKSVQLVRGSSFWNDLLQNPYFKQQEKNDEVKVSAQKRPGGLGSIMGVISGKTPKMGCLDKSKMDWNKFVEDEGIKEDLQSHNRGKDGYVEKQMFLERSDHRRFEIEKAAREKSRKLENK